MSAAPPTQQDLDAAIIGAQLLINDPETAMQILLRPDVYPQLQALQKQAADATREAQIPTNSGLSDEVGQNVKSSTQVPSLSAGASGAAVNNVEPNISTSLKASLDAAVRGLLQGVNPRLGDGAAETSGLSSEVTTGLQALTSAKPHPASAVVTHPAASSPQFDAAIKASLTDALQTLIANNQQQNINSTRQDSIAESRRLLSELQGQPETNVEASSQAENQAARINSIQSIGQSQSVNPQQVMPQGTDITVGDSTTEIPRRFSLLSGQPGDGATGQQVGAQAAVDSSSADVEPPSPIRHSLGTTTEVSSPARKQPQQEEGPAGNARSPMLLYTRADDATLSQYQCLVRQQIEMFEATDDDVQFNISRMSKIIVLGQVGIRCRHCAVLPEHSRPKAAVYYPRTLDSVYQFGQNMVKNHLLGCCKLIPNETKDLMISLQDTRKRGRGGRDRWARAAQERGVVEDENGLRFE